MKPFNYSVPSTKNEALGLLDRHRDDARILLGGTDLVVALRHGAVQPEVVIDLKRLEDLPAGITRDDGTIRITAATVMTDIIEDPRVQHHYPALVEAARVVGSIQIRNRATLAGNICNASPAADTVPPMLVYDAIVEVESTSGTRRIPLDDFIEGPGETVLSPNEMVTAVEMPVPGDSLGSAFGRSTRRRGHDLASINLACTVDAHGVTRFAYGAVGPRAFIVEERDGVLSNPDSDPGEREAALRELISHASPIDDVRASKEYREAMLLTLSERALNRAIARRDGERPEA